MKMREGREPLYSPSGRAMLPFMLRHVSAAAMDLNLVWTLSSDECFVSVTFIDAFATIVNTSQLIFLIGNQAAQ